MSSVNLERKKKGQIFYWYIKKGKTISLINIKIMEIYVSFFFKDLTQQTTKSKHNNLVQKVIIKENSHKQPLPQTIQKCKKKCRVNIMNI